MKSKNNSYPTFSGNIPVELYLKAGFKDDKYRIDKYTCDIFQGENVPAKRYNVVTIVDTEKNNFIQHALANFRTKKPIPIVPPVELDVPRHEFSLTNQCDKDAETAVLLLNDFNLQRLDKQCSLPSMLAGQDYNQAQHDKDEQYIDIVKCQLKNEAFLHKVYPKIERHFEDLLDDYTASAETYMGKYQDFHRDSFF